MSRVVRILGTAHNRSDLPLPHPPDIEVWLANDFRRYRKYLENPAAAPHWTRWFNLHSRKHIADTYPTGLQFLLTQKGDKPYYMQKLWLDIPGCKAFPREELQSYFATSRGPNRYFTCTITWQLALAIYEKFDKIELWGYALSDRGVKKHSYQTERPCFWYWIQQARDRGIDVQYQQEIVDLPFLPGDPDEYAGLLYGFSTKSEDNWDASSETFL